MTEAGEGEQAMAIDQLFRRSVVDTRTLRQIGVGGESQVYQAPMEYRVPGRPDIDPRNVVIKAMLESPAGAKDAHLARVNLAYFWSRYAPPITTLAPDLTKRTADLSQHRRQQVALCAYLQTLYPEGMEKYKDLMRFDEIYGADDNEVAKVNAIARQKGVAMDGQVVRLRGGVFAEIYEMGVSRDMRLFMAMRKVDSMLLDTVERNRRGKVYFRTYQEADSALHVAEMVAALTLINLAGFAVMDVKYANAALVKTTEGWPQLVLIDPTLYPIGTPALCYTEDYLPPEVRSELKSGKRRLPQADPKVDQYAVTRMLEMAVGEGI